jgi:cobyrinic acid a,c-diamide synthase
VFFSPLANETIPIAADAVYLPGGYPELHAEILSQAHDWQNAIRAAHAAGLPILAECGGMMPLTDSLIDVNGQRWKMAGLLDGHVAMQTQLAAIGPHAWIRPEGELRGHAFHYSRLETRTAPFAHTIRHPTGASGEAIYRVGSLTASYFHAYFPSCPAIVARLLLKEER